MRAVNGMCGGDLQQFDMPDEQVAGYLPPVKAVKVPLHTVRSNKFAAALEKQGFPSMPLDGPSSAESLGGCDTHAGSLDSALSDDFGCELDDEFLSFMTTDNPWYNLLEDLASQPESTHSGSQPPPGANNDLMDTAAARPIKSQMPLLHAVPSVAAAICGSPKYGGSRHFSSTLLHGTASLDSMDSFASSCSNTKFAVPLPSAPPAAKPSSLAVTRPAAVQKPRARVLDRAASSSALPCPVVSPCHVAAGNGAEREQVQRTTSEAAAIIPKGPRSKKRGHQNHYHCGAGSDALPTSSGLTASQGRTLKRQRSTTSLQPSARCVSGAEGLQFLAAAAHMTGTARRASCASSGGPLPPMAQATAAAPPAPAAAPAASQQLHRSGSSGAWTASETASGWSDGEEAMADPSGVPGGLRSGMPTSGGIHKRRGSKASTDAYAINHACANCGKCGKTPQTRRGPAGNATLCNACGSRLLKGTFLAESAETWANRYPVDHNDRIVYWPGQETRHCDMLARVEEVRTIAVLVREHGYRFFYNRGDGAVKAARNLNAFIAQYGRGDVFESQKQRQQVAAAKQQEASVPTIAAAFAGDAVAGQQTPMAVQPPQQPRLVLSLPQQA